MRITKKMRADAITICELDGRNAQDCADAIGAVDGAMSLAQEAMAAVARLWLPYDWTISFQDWREAGGILRDGWSPGDPVVRLRGGS